MAHIFHFHEPPHKADQITQLAAKQSGQPRARRLRVTIFALMGILLLLILLVEFARAGGRNMLRASVTSTWGWRGSH